MVMLLSLGWSVQRAEWLEQIEFLVPIAFFALLLGTVLALSPLSVTLTLPISAVVGAGIVLWTIGGEYFPELSQGARFLTLRDDALDWVAHPGRPRLRAAAHALRRRARRADVGHRLHRRLHACTATIGSWTPSCWSARC